MRGAGMLPRRAGTLHGEHEFKRLVFECRDCRASLAPLDAEPGLGKGRTHTAGVRRAAAYEAARGSFADASAALAEHHGIAVSPAEAGAIAHEEGARIAAATQARERAWADGALAPELSPECLVIQADATAVLTRKGQEHKMACVVRTFDLAEPGGDERPRLSHSLFAATAADGALAEGGDLFDRVLALARRAGVDAARRVVFIGDGARPLWLMCEQLFPDAVQIQDLWHVLEHLSGAAAAAAKSKQEADALRTQWGDDLKEGRIDAVLGELRAHRNRLRAPEARETLRKAADYIEAGRHRMDYPRHIREGLPIGSGPIEAACKHVVKERFGITGARWPRADIGDVLALRAALANNEWDRHWTAPPQAKAA